MGFWLFMLLIDLLTPAIMILAGRMMEKHCPKEINSIIGYRTTRSMKNMDTWRFAHEHCGRLWQKVGWIVLIPSVLPMLFVMSAGEELVSIVGLLVCTAQCVVLIASIFPTEHALKQRFHEDGTRIMLHSFANQKEFR